MLLLRLNARSHRVSYEPSVLAMSVGHAELVVVPFIITTAVAPPGLSSQSSSDGSSASSLNSGGRRDQ